ncbi:MAG: hypothetical protein ACK521_09985, partial [bacterium]
MGNLGRVTDVKKITSVHDKMFVPAKVVKEKVKALYEHQSDRVEIKKNFRSEEGDVIIGPKNFLTNP